MNEELIERLYRNWIANNGESQIMFREFKAVCKLIETNCVVQDRKSTAMLLHEYPPVMQYIGELKHEAIVIRDSDPRLILLIEAR